MKEIWKPKSHFCSIVACILENDYVLRNLEIIALLLMGLNELLSHMLMHSLTGSLTCCRSNYKTSHLGKRIRLSALRAFVVVHYV